MTNHVPLIAVPTSEDSLSVLLRRVHGAPRNITTPARDAPVLWQNRFFACVLAPDHLGRALAYGERNPVRAGIVPRAGAYRWSSAATHITGHDKSGLLDMDWWQEQAHAGWELFLDELPNQPDEALRACTHAGRPLGSEEFLRQKADQFDGSLDARTTEEEAADALTARPGQPTLSILKHRIKSASENKSPSSGCLTPFFPIADQRGAAD
jgi:putative transposase